MQGMMLIPKACLRRRQSFWLKSSRLRMLLKSLHHQRCLVHTYPLHLAFMVELACGVVSQFAI